MAMSQTVPLSTNMPSTTAQTTHTIVPDVFLPSFEFDQYHPFTVWIGGRSAGKTRAAGLWVIGYTEWYEARYGQPAYFVCGRKLKTSIDYSSRRVIQNVIRNTGRLGHYKFFNSYTRTPLGGEILYMGLSGEHGTAESMKSMEGAMGIWWEEAHKMDAATRELMYPTVFRTPGARFLITFNPDQPTDPVALDFISPGRRSKNALISHCNFMDLPEAWRDPQEEEERQQTIEYEPERYDHIWGGQLDEGDADTKVLTRYVLNQCVEGYKQGLAPSVDNVPLTDGGLDLAYGGADKCALVIRQGLRVHKG